MQGFLTNSDITNIGFNIAIIISLAIVFTYHYISIRLFAKKINRAIDSNEFKVANDLLKIALKKHPKSREFNRLYLKLANQLEITSNNI